MKDIIINQITFKEAFYLNVHSQTFLNILLTYIQYLSLKIIFVKICTYILWKYENKFLKIIVAKIFKQKLTIEGDEREGDERIAHLLL